MPDVHIRLNGRAEGVPSDFNLQPVLPDIASTPAAKPRDVLLKQNSPLYKPSPSSKSW